MAPLGMPMGGPGGGGGGGKDAPGPRRKVAVRDIPHTEDITGRVDTNRLSVASAAHRDDRQPPGDGGPSDDPPGPIVRRLVTRPPKEEP
jgi:hypothetical protein